MEKRSGNALIFLAAMAVALPAGGCNRRTPQSESVGPSGQHGIQQAAALPQPGQAMPDSAFRLGWGKHDIPTTVTAGATVPIAVTVTNQSTTIWPNAQTADPSQSGAYAVRLAYRWFTAKDLTPIQDYESRVELPKPLLPGESVTLAATVTAPKAPGRYRLQCDLVQELVAWFESKGVPTLIVPVNVQ